MFLDDKIFGFPKETFLREDANLKNNSLGFPLEENQILYRNLLLECYTYKDVFDLHIHMSIFSGDSVSTEFLHV